MRTVLLLLIIATGCGTSKMARSGNDEQAFVTRDAKIQI